MAAGDVLPPGPVLGPALGLPQRDSPPVTWVPIWGHPTETPSYLECKLHHESARSPGVLQQP